MFLLLFFILSHRVETQTCNISVPIGSWLENNTETCTEVLGHFILDQTANKFTRRLFSTFSNLTRIEGCIHVQGFTGANNLSFFSKLKDVICVKKKARESNLMDVIFVSGPSLYKMGFNSLKTVEGPGEIFLSFEEGGKGEQQAYIQGQTEEGKKCFSKEEMIFLAYQPKFRGKMYQPCGKYDPCFRLDHVKKWYQMSDIPKNCTTFVGLICAVGPFDETAIRDRFQNLTLLIGQLQIMGTLFNRLDFAFPQLENIYSYERPNLNNDWQFRSCNDYTASEVFEGVQYTHIGYNRFLTDASLPSIRPIRKFDVSIPSEIEGRIPFGFNPVTYKPDTVEKPCTFFPKLNCGYFTFIEEHDPTSSLENNLFDTGIYVLSMIFTALGLGFSFRTLVLLIFSKVSKSLPYSRLLIILIIIIVMLTAIENCLCYQKIFTTFGFLWPESYYAGQFFSEFSSPLLIHPLIQFLMQFLATSRHICLTVIILCYLDIIYFYRFGSRRISKLFCFISLVFICFLYFYIYPQLFVAIRGRRPNYSKDPRHVVFMPFVLNVNYTETFERQVPDTRSLQYENGILLLSPETDNKVFILDEYPFDISGKSMPDYAEYCDIIMTAISICFYALKSLKIVIPNHNFTCLILLYLQLSISRIRYFTYIEILNKDFCQRKEYYSDTNYAAINCFLDYQVPGNRKIERFMEEFEWKLLEKLLEKLPYILFLIASLDCYLFARHHTFLGVILDSREKLCKKSKDEEETTRWTAATAVSMRHTV